MRKYTINKSSNLCFFNLSFAAFMHSITFVLL